MEGSREPIGSWLRCYRCWSQELEVQVHYEGIHRIDPVTGERGEVVDEIQEAVVQCLDCMHDQPHLGFHNGRIEPIEDRWERMVAGTPWVASCAVTVDADAVETCSGPEAADALAYAAFGDHGTREFFTHVRFHKHDEDQIVVHLLVELYARSSDEADAVLEEAARGDADDHLAGRGVAPARGDRRRAPALAGGQLQHGEHRAVVGARQAVDGDLQHPAALGHEHVVDRHGRGAMPLPRRAEARAHGLGRIAVAALDQAAQLAVVERRVEVAGEQLDRAARRRRRQGAQVGAPAREVAAVQRDCDVDARSVAPARLPARRRRRPPSPTSHPGTAAAAAASIARTGPSRLGAPGPATRCGSTSPRPARSRPSASRGVSSCTASTSTRSRRTRSTSACGGRIPGARWPS